MGLFDRFRSPKPHTRSDSEIRALTSSAGIPSNGSYGGFDAGVYVSERTALQHATVYSCTRLLSDSVSGLPQDVVRKSRAGVRTPIDPTPSIISDPNPETTDVEHMHQVVTSLAIRGNSFEFITEYDKMERPLSRMAIHPDDVTVERNRDDGRRDYKIGGERVPRARMLHIRRLPLAGSLWGLSVIEQARQGIGLSLAAERYGARFFGDSANPTAVFETTENLSDDAVKAFMASWVSSHGGRRHPAFLSGGLKYRPITITPNDSQFLETRRYQRGEIAMLYGIPPHMIGDTEKSTSWGTGIEQQSIGFVKYTLLAWLRPIEAAYSKYLLPRGQYMRFNVSGLLRGDTVQRYTAYTQARNAGWLNVDEIRALEDMEPVPGGAGASYIQPLNMGPLGSDPLAITSGDAPGGEPDAQN